MERNQAGAGDEKKLVTPRNSKTSVIEDLLKEISCTSPVRQMAFGGISGWCTGFVFRKIGKILIVALGGSVLLLQIAQSQGIIEVNWKAIESKTSVTKVKQQFSHMLLPLLDEAKEYAMRHSYISGSFCFGLFIGICS